MPDGQERTLELKVGLFITVGIIMFFILVFSIGDVYLVKKGYYVNVLFNFANGLKESSPVRLAGVDVGQVDRIELFFDPQEKKTKVNLVAWIRNDDIRIERDSEAVINTLGLLGEKYLEIFPGKNTDDILKPDDRIVGRDTVPTELLAYKLDSIANSVNVIMKRLEEGQGTAGKFLVDEKLYDNLEELTADIKAHPWKLLHKPKGE